MSIRGKVEKDKISNTYSILYYILHQRGNKVNCKLQDSVIYRYLKLNANVYFTHINIILHYMIVERILPS